MALKTPLPELTADAPGRERFYRAYLALTRFRHPGLAPVLDFGEHEGAYDFAMAFIDGNPLERLCVTDQFAAARIALAIADAVGHAHDAKIVIPGTTVSTRGTMGTHMAIRSSIRRAPVRLSPRTRSSASCWSSGREGRSNCSAEGLARCGGHEIRLGVNAT